MSVLCFFAIAILCLMKTITLIGQLDPFLTMTESQSNYARIDLFELGFLFAVEALDPRIGKMQT